MTDGERVIGDLITEYPVGRDGFPVLLVDDERFSPGESEFFLESAIQEEMEQLSEGEYDLPPRQEHEEADEYLDHESLEAESHGL